MTCLPHFLIAKLRSFYHEKFPAAAAAWQINGERFYVPQLDADAIDYGARIDEASKHWPAGDPYIKGNDSWRLKITDLATFTIMGGLARIFGGPAQGWIATLFLCAAAWTLLLYGYLRCWDVRRDYALACALSMVLYADLILLFPGHISGGFPTPSILARWILETGKHFFLVVGSYSYFYGMSRLPRPGLTYLPFLLLVWGLTRERRDWRWSAAIGVVAGSAGYFRVDAMVLSLATLGIFFLAESWRLKKIAWPIAAALVLALALSVPPLSVFYPPPESLDSRSFVYRGRMPHWESLIWLAAALAVWWRAPSRARPLACALAACVAALNLQLVLGHNVDPILWNEPPVIFAAAALAGWAGLRWAKRIPSFFWPACVVVALALGRAVGYANQRYPYQGLPRDWERAWDYLRANSAEDSVLAALGPYENLLTPALTDNKVLIPDGLILQTNIPDPEILARLRQAGRIYGISEKALVAAIKDGPNAPTEELWLGRFNLLAFDRSSFPAARISKPIFLDLMKNTPPTRSPAEFEVNYVWVGPFERELMSRAALSRLGAPVYSGGSVSLYAWPPAEKKKLR